MRLYRKCFTPVGYGGVTAWSAHHSISVKMNGPEHSHQGWTSPATGFSVSSPSGRSSLVTAPPLVGIGLRPTLVP
jgi:hypothetical protein